MPLVSRLAPTPSGFLHLGNAVNFLLTWAITRAQGGRLRLRIDDIDAARSRPEFVEDVFYQLDWLGIDWDDGPSSPDDFYRCHSQQLRLDRYRQALELLARSGGLFSCRCSRKDIDLLSPTGIYPGTCRQHPLPPAAYETIRVRTDTTQIQINGSTVALDRTMGDFVVWRRDDMPSYQLASLVDDLDYRITLIVRGRDLLDSTAAQLHLASLLKADAFLSCRFYHHPLLFGEHGKKLSKSDNSLSLCHIRQHNPSPTDIYREAAAMLGIPAELRPGIVTIADLKDLTVADGGINILNKNIFDLPFTCVNFIL